MLPSIKNLCPALLLLIVSMLSFRAHAQKKEYILTGYMGVQGGESFHYDMKLKDSAGNMLSGYANTYSKPENNVRAYVVAEIDRDARTIHIRENTIVENNYFVSEYIICLVEANLKFSGTEKTLSGPLITMTAGNGANCSKGSITFSDMNEINALFNPAAKAAPPAAVTTVPKTTPKPLKIVYDTASKSKLVIASQVPVVPTQVIITEGKDKTYNWNSDEVILTIWDGNTEDGDKVTISYNGNPVIKDYVLTKKQKEIKLPIGGNELNIISIQAINEGGEPPNTANITIKDGDTAYDIIAHNTFGKTALIKIRKKL
ncbi:hypothetical protein F0919_11720 [Taibaiella lutea]|uniref:Uncharacterized protein n=1 Tax=Taibaiella lutea TaxID=2608001 RepID=A0A5M6CDE8_9BACT|nr:hypothetical protein [Taibaiella lutea]KAA5533208.1 hypothetical protein F0919_11720 [Taibaiella lutea]